MKFIKLDTSSYGLMKRIYLGYVIMKLRMKISFHATVKKRTM